MDSAVRIIVLLCFTLGLASTHSRTIPDSSLQDKIRNATFYHERIPIPDATRHPDRVIFSVNIYDKTKTVEDRYVTHHDEILAFQWSHAKNSYSYVQNDNVYYASNPYESPVKVTNREEDGLLHGTFDWAYVEEIRGRGKIGALWFSPSDKYLAYASRHANSSREVVMTTYTKGENYDYNYNMEYPKTGEKEIAVYNVSIFNVETKKSITMDVQLRDRNSFHYLFGVSWVILHGKELLMTTWANRWQNETSITLCSYETATCSLIYEYKYETAQWAEPDNYAEVVHTNSSIFVILPEPMGDNSWQHIAKIEITNDFQLDKVSFVPSGEYDIERIVEYRSDEDVIVYEAQAPLPWNRSTYAAPVGIRSVIDRDECISCEQANFTLKEHVSISHGPSVGFSYLGIDRQKRLTISYSAKWKIEKFILPSGYEAIVKIFVPETQLSSIPVTLYVYGGPNTNSVFDNGLYPFPLDYKYAIVFIDVRGCGGRGWKYRSTIYGKLVTVEVEDTLEAMKIVLEKYPKLDKNRVGVYGWSYGGTMSLALVEKAPPGFFKCALVGAPVINFIYYNAVYTERYMGDTPLADYTDLSVDVSVFRNTSLMLVHGLRDDNVHFQNSALLIAALENDDIPFQLMVYPNMAHSIRLDHEKHLERTFIDQCYAQ